MSPADALTPDPSDDDRRDRSTAVPSRPRPTTDTGLPHTTTTTTDTGLPHTTTTDTGPPHTTTTTTDTGLRPIDRSLPLALLQAREAAMRLFRPLLAANDLTEQQWRVMRAMALAETDLTAGEVADRACLLRPSVSRILAHLEGHGLIERRAVEHDQRSVTLSLTDAGRQVVDRMAPRSEAIHQDIEARFGRERLDRLFDELRALAALDTEAARGQDLTIESPGGTP